MKMKGLLINREYFLLVNRIFFIDERLAYALNILYKLINKAFVRIASDILHTFYKKASSL